MKGCSTCMEIRSQRGSCKGCLASRRRCLCGGRTIALLTRRLLGCRGAGQEHLEKKLDILETHQNEIHNALLSMESEADQLYRCAAANADALAPSPSSPNPIISPFPPLPPLLSHHPFCQTDGRGVKDQSSNSCKT